MTTKTGSARKIFAVSLVSALALMFAAPALASEDSKGKGQAQSAEKSSKSEKSEPKGQSKQQSSGTTVTEDNDNDGQPNSYSGGASQHPSGKDRHIESGKSGNQGKSTSNPDDSKGPMRYEGDLGPDKPTSGSGSLGGGANVYDQDGNNGCGNDQDFDDDNNGWCGRNPKRNPKPEEVAVSELPVIPSDPKLEVPAEVLPKVIEAPAVPVADVELTEDEVLPQVQRRAETLAPAARPAAVLPFTGASLATFFFAALALMGSGAALLIGRRK
jgi:hypothetical protein